MHLMFSDINQIQELQFLVKTFIRQLRDFVNFGRRALHKDLRQIYKSFHKRHHST